MAVGEGAGDLGRGGKEEGGFLVDEDGGEALRGGDGVLGGVGQGGGGEGGVGRGDGGSAGSEVRGGGGGWFVEWRG